MNTPNSSFSEEQVARLFEMLPELHSVAIHIDVPRELYEKFVTTWRGSTRKGVPFDVNHSLVYTLYDLPNEQMGHVYKAAILGEEGRTKRLRVYYRDGTEVTISRNQIDIKSNREPPYIEKIQQLISQEPFTEFRCSIRLQGS